MESQQANGSHLVGQDWSLRSQLEPVRRRWWLIAIALFIGALAGYVYSQFLPPRYEGAASVVSISGGGGTLSFIPALVDQQGALLDTEAEIIHSRAVISRAVEKLKVDDRNKVFQDIRDSLSVVRPRNTTIMRISTQGPTPQKAAEYANAVADAFLEWHLLTRREQLSAGRKFIEDQVQKVAVTLREAEDRLAAYKVRTGQVDLSSQTQAAVARISSLQSQLQTATIERKGLETNLVQTRAQLGLQAETVTRPTWTVQDDPRLAQLRAQLTSQEIDLATLRQQYTDEHPRVVAILARIEEIKKQMAQLSTIQMASQVRELNPLRRRFATNIIQMQIDREALLAREAALSSLLAQSQRDLRSLPPAELEITRLMRDELVAEGTYVLLRQKLQEARIAEASVVGDFRIVDRAVPRRTPVVPRVGLNTLLGVLAGLVFGVGLAYLGEAFDTSFRTPEEAATSLGLPLLAAIPATRRLRSVQLIVAEPRRRDSFAEAFRHLRTNLLFLNPDHPLRTVMVTSPGPDEGKSTVSANLAVSMTQTGRRVWLLECDLRNPILKWAFQPKQPYGLTDLLVDGIPIDATLNTTQVENLWFISSGTIPPNPSELLGSQKMQAFLEHGDSRVQLIVLDAPPVLPVTDATVLGHSVDGIVLVVHLVKTPRDAAIRALEQLHATGARVVGLVVNGVPRSRRPGYYGYDYESYGDQAGASEGTATGRPPRWYDTLRETLRGRPR